MQLLWGNTHIKIKWNVFYWKHLVCADILVIGDIVNKNGLTDLSCSVKVKEKRKLFMWIKINLEFYTCKMEKHFTIRKSSNWWFYSKLITSIQSPTLCVKKSVNKNFKLSKQLYNYLIDKNSSALMLSNIGLQTYKEPGLAQNMERKGYFN